MRHTSFIERGTPNKRELTSHIQKQSSGSVRKIHRKTPVPESQAAVRGCFSKQVLGLQRYYKENHVFSREYCEIFTNSLFMAFSP